MLMLDLIVSRLAFGCGRLYSDKVFISYLLSGGSTTAHTVIDLGSLIRGFIYYISIMENRARGTKTARLIFVNIT